MPPTSPPSGGSPTPPPAGEEIYRVTTLELFFDLVFVFAITQLTGVLTAELSPLGLARVVLMFGVLWWMYNGYAWLTNTMAPTTPLRRLVLLAGMGGFFLVALATPTAFQGGGVVWGVGYLILVLAHAGLYVQTNRQILRVLPGNMLAALLIIAAGFAEHGPAVYVLWTLALVIPIALPYVVRSGGRFHIQAEHIVERYGLLVIITLGESIIAIGVGAQDVELTAGLAVAALLGLALAATVWWSYFTGDDERAEHSLAAADPVRRTEMTMFGYFYAHIPVIVGVVVLAAGLKKTAAHAWDHLTAAQALALGGGLALYLVGDAVFRRIVGIGPSGIRLVAAVAALAAVPVGMWVATAEVVLLIAILAAALAVERRRTPSTRTDLGESTRD